MANQEQQIIELKKQVKEKEQENRISKLKVKEMKRLVKHKQLRPLASIRFDPTPKKPR